MIAQKAINDIREIAALLYDGYGEDIHPTEQLEMIGAVLERYKEKQDVSTME
jgi:hypothetical protein